MTKLEHPTMAERAVERVREEGSKFSTVCRKMGAEVRREWDAIWYVFDDDSELAVKGRGRNQSYETFLP